MNTIRYKTSSFSQLADAYGVTNFVFKKWLVPMHKDIGDCIGRCFSPKQISIIIDFLGQPEHIKSLVSSDSRELL